MEPRDPRDMRSLADQIGQAESGSLKFNRELHFVTDIDPGQNWEDSVVPRYTTSVDEIALLTAQALPGFTVTVTQTAAEAFDAVLRGNGIEAAGQAHGRNGEARARACALLRALAASAEAGN